MSDPAYADYIRSLSITTQAQADGYRKSLAIWDKNHPQTKTPEPKPERSPHG